MKVCKKHQIFEEIGSKI